MKKYVLALDQGTTSTRAVIFNHSGEIVESSQREFNQYFPEPGWVEHNAIEIWQSVMSVVSEVFIKSTVLPKEVCSIGITNQRETTVIWDRKTGLPVYNALVWQSRQTKNYSEQFINDGYSELIKDKTGLTIDSYFSATKIMWLLDNVPTVRERAEKGELLFGTIDTWLIWKLTGGGCHVTDYTNASRTMLFNIYELTWDKDLLSLFNIPESLLPEVKSSSHVFGYTKEYHMFGEIIPISGVAGDQQASLFGQNCFKEGQIKNTYGTGCFILMNTGDRPFKSNAGLLTTLAINDEGNVSYALEGSIFVAGSSIQWLRDGLEIINDSAETDKMSTALSSNEGVYVVPAFVGLGAPYWDSDVRGAMFGLTRGTTREVVARATLESIAYQTKDVIDTMINETGLEFKVLRVDGGASKNQFLMQFQADILNTEIHRPEVNETTVLGAAYLAGLSVGYWKDCDDIQKNWKKAESYVPNMTEIDRSKYYANWKSAVSAARSFRTIK